MEMSNIYNTVIFVFGSIGFTQIVVESQIIKPVKTFLAKFLPSFLMSGLDCYQCTGFWAGVFCSFLLMDYNQVIADPWLLRICFVCGCAGSCLSYFWAYLITFIEANTVLK